MDRGERDAVAEGLGGDDAAERVERRLRRDVRREPGRVRLHADRRDVDDVPEPPLRSCAGASPRISRTARSSSAPSCARSRGTGRTTSLIDRRIDRPALLTSMSTGLVLLEHRRHQRVDRLVVGEVARVHPRPGRPPARSRPAPPRASSAAGDEHRHAARGGDLERGGSADARRRAGDHDPPAGERTAGALAPRPVAVEVLRPVASTAWRRTRFSAGAAMPLPSSAACGARVVERRRERRRGAAPRAGTAADRARRRGRGRRRGGGR